MYLIIITQHRGQDAKPGATVVRVTMLLNIEPLHRTIVSKGRPIRLWSRGEKIEAPAVIMRADPHCQAQDQEYRNPPRKTHRPTPSLVLTKTASQDQQHPLSLVYGGETTIAQAARNSAVVLVSGR